MRLIKFVAWALIWAAAILWAFWAFGALYYDFPIAALRTTIAVLFAIALLAVLIFVRGHLRKFLVVAAAIALVNCWWLTLEPSDDSQWQPDVAETAWADIDGDRVTVHDVRNCNYRTEHDFDVHWEARTVRFSQIVGCDLAIMYWGSPYMAHPIVSFRFADALPLCFSIETRKAVGQEYSALRGLYRQYTLIYITADERDSIRVRSNYRHGEDVYLFRTMATPDQARERFREYLSALNSLHTNPRWYNAVTTNCTTSIRTQRPTGLRTPWDWRLLVNGKADELLYERHLIATDGLPFAELKEKSRINDRGKAADQDPDFSKRIREGVPGFASE
jgi:hypothetical protein